MIGGAVKSKVKQKSVDTASNSTDDNKNPLSLMSIGSIGCLPMSLIAISPIGCLLSLIILVAILFSNILGIIQIADGAKMNEHSSSIEASNYLEWAASIAEDDSHGYDQGGRNGPDYDCSSLVWHSLVESGTFTAEELGGSAFATSYMAGILISAGFSEYSYNDNVDDLQPGDILLRSGHTEIYYGDGKTVGAHCNEFCGILGGEEGDQTGSEIDIAPIRGYWNTYYRLEGD